MKYVLLALFALTFLGDAIAQQYPIRTISFNEGLPSAQVSDIVQDHDGVIWMATFSGLVKYDGVNMTILDTNDGLINNIVYDLFIDSDSTFWVSGEGGGVQILEGDTLTYPTWINNTIGEFGINNIEESADGRLWFATYDNGVFVLDQGELTQLSTDDGLAHNRVWHSWFDKNGHIWFSTEGGISIYDGKNFANYDSTDGLSSSIVYRVVEDESETIWIPTHRGLSKYQNGAFQTVTGFSVDDVGSVYDVIVDSYDRLWVASAYNGLFIKDGDNRISINENDGLSSDYLFRVFEDQFGAIWVATDENGVNIFSDINIKYYSSESELNQNTVLSIHQSGSALWLGTNDGLHYWRGSSFDAIKIRPFVAGRGKPDVDIWNIEELRNGNLLVHANATELYEYDGIRQPQDYLKKIGFNDELYINDILIDSQNRLWIGTELGIVKYDKGDFTRYSVEDGLSNDFTYHIFEDSNGRIWIGNETGVQYFEGDELVNVSAKYGIEETTFFQITEDKSGNIWLGTSQGICVLMRTVDGWDYKHFQMVNNYLSDTMVLHVDKYGNLWQGTNGGIHQYFISDYRGEESLRSRYYALDEYGEGVEVNHKAVFEKEDGTILMGTSGHGLLEIEPRPIDDFHSSQTPLIVSAKANLNSFYEEGEYFQRELKSDQNNINISFSALGYSDPFETFYNYRLKGFDDEWKVIQNQHYVSYTNLPAGNYTFELISKSGSFDWSKEASVLSFTIAKPFYTQLWFIMLGISVLGLFVMGYMNYRLERVEKKKLQHLVDEQTKELSNALDEKIVLIKEIHHRVKNNMAVISGLLELKIMSATDDQTRSDLIESQLRIRTMASIHEKLYKSDSLANIDIKNYIEDLVRVISHSLKRQDLEVDIDLQVDDVKITVHQALPAALAINEIIANSYEHAFQGRSKGKVTVRFKEEKENMILVIKDDGVGIPKEYLDEDRDSLGITLIDTFVSQLKGQIEYKVNGGTEVKIAFAKELYPDD